MTSTQARDLVELATASERRYGHGYKMLAHAAARFGWKRREDIGPGRFTMSDVFSAAEILADNGIDWAGVQRINS